jgi:hypothetical protein
MPHEYNPYYYFPHKTPQGKFVILIITSGRILRWPYSRHSEEPKYATRKDAEKIIQEYLKFANTSKYTKIKRCINEFEVVDLITDINK